MHSHVFAVLFSCIPSQFDFDWRAKLALVLFAENLSRIQQHRLLRIVGAFRLGDHSIHNRFDFVEQRTRANSRPVVAVLILKEVREFVDIEQWLDNQECRD
jgi:hypothetical protein